MGVRIGRGNLRDGVFGAKIDLCQRLLGFDGRYVCSGGEAFANGNFFFCGRECWRQISINITLIFFFVASFHTEN